LSWWKPTCCQMMPLTFKLPHGPSWRLITLWLPTHKVLVKLKPDVFVFMVTTIDLTMIQKDHNYVCQCLTIVIILIMTQRYWNPRTIRLILCVDGFLWSLGMIDSLTSRSKSSLLAKASRRIHLLAPKGPNNKVILLTSL